LPPFIRTPAINLIGPKCYRTLVENLDLYDELCLKFAISKVLGVGIVLGGAIVKLPQLVTLLSSQSGHGVSVIAYILETAATIISLVYSARQGFSFSTYGEGLFISIQNILITLLIMYFARRRAALVGLIGLIIVGCYSLFTTSSSTLAILQALTIPLNLLSKVPQIASNFKKKSTGQLSAFAVFNYLLGSLARVFTTITEVSDPLVLWGYVLAVVLNAVLVIQMVIYWTGAKKGQVKPRKHKRR
ncbi:Mannose-P-dolichol utilization defect 1 protein, partial [Neolecta irregularis DAH-3]